MAVVACQPRVLPALHARLFVRHCSDVSLPVRCLPLNPAGHAPPHRPPCQPAVPGGRAQVCAAVPPRRHPRHVPSLCRGHARQQRAGGCGSSRPAAIPPVWRSAFPRWVERCGGARLSAGRCWERCGWLCITHTTMLPACRCSCHPCCACFACCACRLCAGGGPNALHPPRLVALLAVNQCQLFRQLLVALTRRPAGWAGRVQLAALLSFPLFLPLLLSCLSLRLSVASTHTGIALLDKHSKKSPSI